MDFAGATESPEHNVAGCRLEIVESTTSLGNTPVPLAPPQAPVSTQGVSRLMPTGL